MGRGPRGGRGAPEQGRHRARHRNQGPGQSQDAGAVLRRRFPFGAGGRQSSENGLRQRHLARRRLARAEGIGPATGKVGGRHRVFAGRLRRPGWKVGIEPPIAARRLPPSLAASWRNAVWISDVVSRIPVYSRAQEEIIVQIESRPHTRHAQFATAIYSVWVDDVKPRLKVRAVTLLATTAGTTRSNS